MKTRETKQKDLTALTESLQNSTSAMVVSFSKLTVTKDQEFRKSLREAGAKYQVVKNTLARIAVKGTPFEDTTDHLKGVTAIAWTDSDPVVLSKAISKFMKDNADVYTFKTGVVDGKLVNLAQLTTIASLPSKEELISKLLFVINAQAQRIVTVINAVPRDLAIVIKQIGEQKESDAAPAAEAAPATETPTVVEAAPAAEAAPAVEAAPETETAPAAEIEAAPAAETATEAEAPPAAEIEAAPAAETDAPGAETSAEAEAAPAAEEPAVAEAEPAAEEKTD
ncbi:MAG: 50S ribosomal protein L10 [Acidobacteriota bacterium]